MARNYSEREPSVLDEAEKIIQKKQFGKGLPSEFVWEFEHRGTISLADYWYQMVASMRRLPQIELIDEISEIRQKIAILHNNVESIKRELASHKKAIYELHKEAETKPPLRLSRIDELCKAYIELVHDIDVVHQVLLSVSDEAVTIWTIIDAQPFEDSLRIPIYEAQLKVLRMTRGEIPLDFHVLNLSEFSSSENIGNVVSSGYKIIWQR